MKTNLKKPSCPSFSCGPTRKYTLWEAKNLDTKMLGRSHRSEHFLKQSKELVNKTRKLLDIPSGYKVILTPGSATGAIELGIWAMASKLPINSFVFDSFSLDRAILLCNELKLKDTKVYFLNNFLDENIVEMFENDCSLNVLKEKTNVNATKEFNKSNIKQQNITSPFDVVDFNNQDTVLTLCGTSMAVDFKNLESIPKNRKGLVFADATSYAFCQKMPWQSLDVTAWSLQKALGSEPGMGVLVLSERAVERVNSFKPSFPCPKIYNIRNKKGLIDETLLNSGQALITYSGLVIADCMLALNYYTEKGIDYFYNKVKENIKAFDEFVKESQFFSYMIEDESYRSLNVAYLKVKDSFFTSLSGKQQDDFINKLCKILEEEEIAYDIKSYRYSPLGIRFWLGPLIEHEDVKLLCNHLEHTYNKVLKEFKES